MYTVQVKNRHVHCTGQKQTCSLYRSKQTSTLYRSKTDIYTVQVKTDKYIVQVKNRYLHFKNKTFAGQEQK